MAMQPTNARPTYRRAECTRGKRVPSVRVTDPVGCRMALHATAPHWPPVTATDWHCPSIWWLQAPAVQRLMKQNYARNAHARLVTSAPRREHITPILRQLHWLPVRQRDRYKLATLAFRSLSPAYLTDDCQLVAESGRGSLRSAERSVRVIQRCNNTFGDRSFAVAGPRAWNDLPAALCNTQLTVDTFCKHLITVVFTDSWGRGAFVKCWYRPVYKCFYLLTYLLTCYNQTWPSAACCTTVT